MANIKSFNKVNKGSGSIICNDTVKVCVNSNLDSDVLSRHQEAIKSTFVNRKDPQTLKQSLMKTTGFLGLVNAGQTLNLTSLIDFKEVEDRKSFSLIDVPPELKVKAKWIPAKLERGQAGEDANVFGGLGVLEVVTDSRYDELNIPVMNALQAPPLFLQKYGAELIPVTQDIEIPYNVHPELRTLYMTEYTWQPGYIPQYVMNIDGGGGLFVETHPFPHLFTPLDENCGGALILGVADSTGSITFTALEIPYGYTMKIDANVIHGDSFFTGRYAIALTETELADSVLLKTPKLKGGRDSVPVKQYSYYELTSNDLEVQAKFTRKCLQQEVEKTVLFDETIKVSQLPQGFFGKQPNREFLHQHRNASDKMRKDFDSQFGLTIPNQLGNAGSGLRKRHNLSF